MIIYDPPKRRWAIANEREQQADWLTDWPYWKIAWWSFVLVTGVIAWFTYMWLQLAGIDEHWHEWNCHRHHGARMQDMGEMHEMCVISGKMTDEWGEQ